MYQRTDWVMSKRSKWRPLKSAGVSEGSSGMPLIIDILHSLHQNHLGHVLKETSIVCFYFLG